MRILKDLTTTIHLEFTDEALWTIFIFSMIEEEKYKLKSIP
jgi:hypothetical protein